MIADADTGAHHGRVLAGLGLAAVVAGLLHWQGSTQAIVWTAAIATCCAFWWVSEAMPHAIAALLPLGSLPLLGILSPEQVAQAYGNPLILLLAGGFMLANALEANDAHRRLALGMVRLFGAHNGRQLVYGFAAAAALTSMWISNTATTLMLLPVVLAVLQRYPDPRLAAPLVLAVAYSASLGGLGTPIGSPPNLVFMQAYGKVTGSTPSFIDWIGFGLPMVAIAVPLTAWWLGRGLADSPPAQLQHLPPWSPAERRVLLVFALVAAAWVTRTAPFGGWQRWLDLPRANDASVALLGVIVMALVPNGKGGSLLSWKQAERIPWGALILFGGGIALATAFEVSGLSQALAGHLQVLLSAPLWLQIILIALAVTLLSEIASNTAAAVLLMPLLAAAASNAGIDPAQLMVPAVLAASCGFMLPVATAPNAIAFGSGQVSAQNMLREGAMVDLIGVVAITLVCLLLLY